MRTSTPSLAASSTSPGADAASASGADLRRATRRIYAAARARLDVYALVAFGLKPEPHHRQWYARWQEALSPGGAPGQRRVVIVAPPGSAKSSCLSLVTLCWFLGHYPHKAVLAVTSSDTMANQFGQVAAQALASNAEHQHVFPDPACRPDRARGWSSDGYYLAGVPVATKDPSLRFCGFGASVIGSRAHLLILDDALTQQAAQSEVEMETSRRYVDQSLATRLHPDGVILAISTRWAERDLVEHLEQQGFEVLLYPQLSADYPWKADLEREHPEQVDAEGRVPLWPGRYPLAWVQAEQQRLGSAQFSLLHQGDPLLMGGAVFREAAWFRPLPPFVHQPTPRGRPYLDECIRVTYVDVAWSSRQTADWTVACTLAYHPQDPARALYLTHLWRRRIDQGELAERLMEHLVAVRPHVVGIEQGAYQQPATAELLHRLDYLSNRQLATYIRAIPSVQDKVTRARPAAAKAEAGLLYVDTTLPDWPVLERECLALPLGATDDCVDALSGATAMAVYGVEALTRGAISPGAPQKLRFSAG